jgi:hypothetical protein
MRTQEELWAEYERLKAAELYEEAGKVLDLIEPISDEERLRIFQNAEEVDEPLPQVIRERMEAYDAAARAYARRAG